MVIKPIIKISIHAAQEGCDSTSGDTSEATPISIHAAQEGCDRQSLSMRWNLQVFQSTQPKRAATKTGWHMDSLQLISIHAAQEGCDLVPSRPSKLFIYFNPRSPRGLRQVNTQLQRGKRIFQSTQPKRAATKPAVVLTAGIMISIHAAQEGCDFDWGTRAQSEDNFNPRSPRGLRP